MYTYLIDAYRLRTDDEYNLAGEVRPATLYSPFHPQDVLGDFRKFLDLAETREGSLPGWWDARSRMECEDVGKGGVYSWSSLWSAVEPEHVVKRYYGDEKMVGRLRDLASRVYGKVVARAGNERYVYHFKGRA